MEALQNAISPLSNLADFFTLLGRPMWSYKRLYLNEGKEDRLGRVISFYSPQIYISALMR